MSTIDETVEVGRVESAISHLEVAEKDAKIASRLIELLTTLVEVKKEVQGSDPEKYPFRNLKLNSAAKEFVCSGISWEYRLTHLLVDLLQCKTLANPKKGLHTYTPEQRSQFFDDIAVFEAWFTNIHTMQKNHVQHILTIIHELMQNEMSRGQEIDDCIRKRMKCQKHEEPACAKSLDGKSLVCLKCFEKEEKEQKDE